MKDCGLQVVGARLIIREQLPEEKLKSGIILIASSKEPTYTGTVLAVGEGAYLENGYVKPMTVKPGQTVMYAKFAGTPIKFKNEEYIILNERDVLVVIKDVPQDVQEEISEE